MDFSAIENFGPATPSEDGVSARFYDRSQKTDKIDAYGFPVFENVCFCEIRIKDNNSEIFDQPATADKIRRFPQEYARYQLARKAAVEGTPLEQFAFLTLSETEALKCRGILTVEALAGLSDERAQDLGVGREKKLAVKFMQKAGGNQQLLEWQKAEDRYQARIKELEEAVAALRQAVRNKEKTNEKHS